MFSKTVDKFIAGALVATNILSVSASAGVDNDRREVQGKIASTEKSYNECDLVEYYDTYENACKRLEYLQKYCNVLSSDIVEGNFDVVRQYTDKYVIDSNASEMLENAQKAILEKGGVVTNYSFEKGPVKEIVSSKEILSSNKTLKGNSEKDALEQARNYVTKLEKEYSDEKYDVDVDIDTKPIYEIEPEKIDVSKRFDSKQDALAYVNDMKSKGYDVNYDINEVNINVNSDVEYVYTYDRDTAHGLLFDKDQAEVYLIAHRRVRPDLIAQGYALTDISFERVRRWDTWTYDIVYTYSKPIVKTTSTVKYDLDATLTKDGIINGYEADIDYTVTENEFEESIKDILTISSEVEENINGFKLEVRLLLDEFINFRNGQIDKDIPRHDIYYFFEKLENIIPKPDTEEEKERLEKELETYYEREYNKDTPKTGDDRNIELYLFLAGLSTFGLIATGKKKEDEIKKTLK